MKKLALLLLVFALPLFAGTFENVVVRNGNTSFNYGDEPNGRNLGRRYAYFEKDGLGYVITDTAVMTRILDELQPQIDIGHEQARLGAEQARIGGLQATVGGEQAAIGAQQAAHWDEPGRMRGLEVKQRRLVQRQEELANQQRPLAEQQQVLARKQREATSLGEKRLKVIFEEAMRTGVAKRR